MAITRSKTLLPQVKNESSEDSNTARLLHSTNNTTKGRVNKRQSVVRKSHTQASSSAPKTGSANSKSSNAMLKERWVTDEKIKNIIHYVEHDKMSLRDAGKKANLGSTATYKYYGIYRDDPEHKIPTLGYDVRRGKNYFSYEHIEAMINSIVRDKLTIVEAAEKSGMHRKTVMNYYTKYMVDPQHKIPVRATTSSRTSTNLYTQEQIEELIDYVDEDHLTVREAAQKLNMGESSAYRYYNRYKSDPENKVPSPYRGPIKANTTSDQVKNLIRYIVDDKMSLKKAAIKVDLSHSSANYYYSIYLRDPERKVPVPGIPKYSLHRRCNQTEVNALIGYIVNDKMTAADAARKLGLAPDTARRYYRKYLLDPEKKIPLVMKLRSRPRTTYDQIRKLIAYIVYDKMSIQQAALKVGMDRTPARRYYKQYLEDPNHAIPVPIQRDPVVPKTEQIKQFFSYVLDDNMQVTEAGRKAGLRNQAGHIYYKIYKNDPLRAYSRPDVDEQAKQLVSYVNDVNMSIKEASEKLNITHTAGIKLYNECKDDVKNRPRNKIDKYNENLKVIAEIYKKYQKME
jgi:transposase